MRPWDAIVAAQMARQVPGVLDAVDVVSVGELLTVVDAQGGTRTASSLS